MHIPAVFPSLCRLSGILLLSALFTGCAKQFNGNYNQVKLAIDSIVPATGTAGTAVRIYGRGFLDPAGTNKVYFNGAAAQVDNSAALGMLLVYAPATGTTGNVTVANSGDSAAGPVFSYADITPHILSISPTSGVAGTSVTITGSNFLADTAKNSVYFNGVKAAVVSASSTRIVVIAPNSSSGAVSVTVNGKTASGPVFTYVVPTPVITNIVYNGLFAITGQHFAALATVKIGGQLASGFNFSDLGNGQNQLVNQNFTPASNLNNPAPVTVTVSNVSSAAYSFLFAPVIQSVTPSTVSDNDDVTLQGILFGDRTLASSVKAFYFAQNGDKTYMSPDPVVVSWNTNTIHVTMQDYGSYPIGNGVTPFYLEVNVGARSGNVQVSFHIL